MILLVSITLVSGIGFLILLFKALKDGKKSKPGTIMYIPDRLHEKDEVGKELPDRILKTAILRNRLNKIKDERSQTKKEE